MLTNNYFNYKSWDFENPISTTMIGIIDLYDFVIFFLILILWSVVVVFCVSTYSIYSDIFNRNSIENFFSVSIFVWHKNFCQYLKNTWFEFKVNILLKLFLIKYENSFSFSIRILPSVFKNFIVRFFFIFCKEIFSKIVKYLILYSDYIYILLGEMLRTFVINRLTIFMLTPFWKPSEFDYYYNCIRDDGEEKIKDKDDDDDDDNDDDDDDGDVEDGKETGLIEKLLRQLGWQVIVFSLINAPEENFFYKIKDMLPPRFRDVIFIFSFNTYYKGHLSACNYVSIFVIYNRILKLFFRIMKTWYICFQFTDTIYNKKFVKSSVDIFNNIIFRKKGAMLVKIDSEYNYFLGWKKSFFSPFFETSTFIPVLCNYQIVYSLFYYNFSIYLIILTAFLEAINFFIINLKHNWKNSKFVYYYNNKWVLDEKFANFFLLDRRAYIAFFGFFTSSIHFWNIQNYYMYIYSGSEFKSRVYNNNLFWPFYKIIRCNKFIKFLREVVFKVINKYGNTRSSFGRKTFYSYNQFLSTIIDYSGVLKFYRLNTFLYNNATVEFIWISIPAILLLFMAIPSLLLIYSIDEWINPLYTIIIIGNQWFWSYEYSNICLWGLDNFLYRLMLSHYGAKLNLITAMEWHAILNNVYIQLDIHKSLIENSSLVSETNLPFGYPRLLTTDNVLLLPSHTSMRLLVTSSDVIHSWAVPDFGIKIDAVPGRLNQVFFSSNFYGTSWGQCSELCGVHHAFMPIEVRVVPLCIFEKYLDYHFSMYLDLIIENLYVKLDKVFDYLKIYFNNN